MTELKPCPFCGRNDYKVHVRRQGNKGYRVICSSCGASGPYVAIKEWHDNKFIAQGQAVKAWNREGEQMKDKVQRLYERICDKCF